MIYYLTYNDEPSGVFKGQVADVVSFINSELNLGMRLVAFVSLRGFGASRKKIRSWSPSAIVLPMVPRIRNWKLNRFLLRVACARNTKFMLCRGPFATALALELKASGRCKKVGYDGRGAFAAEWTEYDMGQEEAMKTVMRQLEERAVRESDFRLAVSAKLVEYWQREYAYKANNHVVVPCTLNKGFGALPGNEAVQKVRAELGFAPSDVVLVYSGSTAGWQSFELLEQVLTEQLQQHPFVRVLFLSREEPNNKRLAEAFPGRVAIRWVAAEEVPQMLAACDYGILIRENTVTNQVAAPTKFAEYLHSGLKVLISEHIGDYTDFVRTHKCGAVVPQQPIEASPVKQEEKQRMRELAQAHFAKNVFTPQYKQLYDALAS